MNAVEISGVSKYFKSKKGQFWALRDVSLNIKKGEIFSILGPNGAGKSTLLNIITNTLTASEGNVKILGMEARNYPDILEKVGFMSSESNVHWSLHVRDVLNFYGKLYGVKKSVLVKRREQLIKEFDLEKISGKSFHVLSTGERARLIFAKALLHQPKVILLDEPTSGLDPEMAQRVRKMIRKINKAGTTVILTSHNMTEVEQLSDQIAFIHQGKIVDIGTVEKVKLKHFSTFNAYFKVSEVRNKTLLRKKGFVIKGKMLRKTLQVGESLSKWLAYLDKQKIDVQEVETKRPGLEDYFVKIANKK
jgi:ABC-2 type transport system ATP-binding protein